MTIRQSRADEWRALRDLRLRALRTDPDAFGATLADEERFSDDDWRTRAARNATSELPCFVEERGGALLAMAVGAHDAIDRSRAHLFGMFVAPEARAGGVGRALVAAVVEWARASGAAVIDLECNIANAAALALYQRCGFVDTGIRGPMRHGRGTQTRMELALTR